MQDYFSIHNVNEAHKYSKGKGVKVGVIDWLFDAKDNGRLYAGKVDLSGNLETLEEIKGHGFQMAATLKQIAPECEIYAINAISPDYNSPDFRDKNAKLLMKAIDWAIEKKLDILTYSQQQIPEEYKTELHEHIAKARNAGIITTFIHCDDELNFWPYGCFEFREQKYFKCLPDFNIYHYDYNYINEKLTQEFNEKIKNSIEIKSGNEIPHFSLSSTSPVLAGFIAIIKSLDKTLTPEQTKTLLNNSAYALPPSSPHWYVPGSCNNVIDIGKAILKMIKKEKNES